MLSNIFDSTDKLFITLTIILLLSNLIYRVMYKFKRPMVIGGVLAGVLINHLNLPSQYFDIKTCAGLGQIGIVLFMMIVGNQLSYKRLFAKTSQIPVSLLNILLPFGMGFLFAGYLINHNLVGNIPSNLHLTFKLFIGLAVSMTAFPIMSMFLKNIGLLDTKIGRLGALCGLLDELFFWIMLGGILLAIQKDYIFTWFKPFDIIFYLTFVIFIAPKILKFLLTYIHHEKTMLSFIVIGCFISAALADSVNLHQIFGGFLFGLILPHDNPLIIKVREQLSQIINYLLLPIYFVETGLVANLHLTAVNMTMIYLVLILTTIALVGKFGGSYITGKLSGHSNHESAFLGSLLNIRGIIEIVLLNIALEVGLINDGIYTILICMTLICTFAATSFSLYFSKYISGRVENDS